MQRLSIVEMVIQPRVKPVLRLNATTVDHSNTLSNQISPVLQHEVLKRANFSSYDPITSNSNKQHRISTIKCFYFIPLGSLDRAIVQPFTIVDRSPPNRACRAESIGFY